MTEHKAPIAPVIDTTGCRGHVRPTAKGFVAYDANDKSIGVFASAGAAAAAILMAGST